MTETKDVQYWLLAGELPSGPFTAAQVHSELAAGRATWETLACPVDGSGWQPIVRIPGFGTKQRSVRTIGCPPQSHFGASQGGSVTSHASVVNEAYINGHGSNRRERRYCNRDWSACGSDGDLRWGRVWTVRMGTTKHTKRSLHTTDGSGNGSRCQELCHRANAPVYRLDLRGQNRRQSERHFRVDRRDGTGPSRVSSSLVFADRSMFPMPVEV